MIVLKKRTLARLALLVALCLILVVDALLVEPYRLVVEEVEIALDDLPPALEGLRIAQISDMHIKRLRQHDLRTQDLLRRLEPDMIVITGDLIEHAADYEIWAQRTEQVGAFLDGLPAAPHGIWAVRGNTDLSRYGGHGELLVRRIQQSPVHLLINEWIRLSVRGETVYLLGIDWAHLPEGYAADYAVADEEGNRSLAAGPCDGNAFAHYMPDGWPTNVGYTFTGRLRYTDLESGIGIVFGSRFPWGENRFFRLRSYAEKRPWHLASKGMPTMSGDTTSDIAPEPDKWYRFRVRLEPEGGRLRLRARFWPEGRQEPEGWQIETVSGEELDQEALGGTIGLWSVGPGWKYYDDLCIRWDTGEWCDDFESYKAEADPPHWLDFGVNKGNVRQAMRGVLEGATTILLAHSPDAIHEAVEEGVDLVLSGHTHGGQVRLPLIGPLYANTDLGRAYHQGLFRFDGTWLYITRGVGTRAFPVRFLCPPEVTLITLRQG